MKAPVPSALFSVTCLIASGSAAKADSIVYSANVPFTLSEASIAPDPVADPDQAAMLWAETDAPTVAGASEAPEAATVFLCGSGILMLIAGMVVTNRKKILGPADAQ